MENKGMLVELKTGQFSIFDIIQTLVYADMWQNSSEKAERIEADKDGHEYYRDGVRLFGVTETISKMLRPWNFQDDEPAAVGTWVHERCADFDRIGYDPAISYLETIKNPELKNRLLAYLKFKKDYNLNDVKVFNETTISKGMAAGTIDKFFCTETPFRVILLYLKKGGGYDPRELTRFREKREYLNLFQSAINVLSFRKGRGLVNEFLPELEKIQAGKSVKRNLGEFVRKLKGG